MKDVCLNRSCSACFKAEPIAAFLTALGTELRSQNARATNHRRILDINLLLGSNALRDELKLISGSRQEKVQFLWGSCPNEMGAFFQKNCKT